MPFGHFHHLTQCNVPTFILHTTILSDSLNPDILYSFPTHHHHQHNLTEIRSHRVSYLSPSSSAKCNKPTKKTFFATYSCTITCTQTYHKWTHTIISIFFAVLLLFVCGMVSRAAFYSSSLLSSSSSSWILIHIRPKCITAMNFSFWTF